MHSATMRFAMLAVLLGGRLLHWQSPPEQHDFSSAQFTMGPNYVRVPEGFFVIIRKGNEVGAIRFTRIVQDREDNGKSTYESYFQGDGSGSLAKSNVVKRTGEIDIRPLRGWGHPFGWQPGQDKLWVGKWWFGCLTPSLVNMSPHFSQKDEGYEFAPTSAQSIGEIDVSDKRLRWFRFTTESRAVVPVADLPK